MTKADHEGIGWTQRLFARWSCLALTLLISSCGNELEPSTQRSDDLDEQSTTRALTALRWSDQQKLMVSDKASGDYFGNAVALSADGNTAIVGAWAKSDGSTVANGAAYIYARSGTSWTLLQKLAASDATNGSYFGSAVALSADGNTAMVGADGRTEGSAFAAGAVYVFARVAGRFTEQQRLIASDRAANSGFGLSLALSADGNTALIGADGVSSGSVLGHGAVYVFSRSAGSYVEQQKLIAGDMASSDAFGWSVALSADGNTALIGANGKAEGALPRSGAAYLFSRSGATFSQLQKLTASDRGSGDAFGESVALSADGNTALIGAMYEDDGGTANNGAVYLFVRGTAAYAETQKLLAGDRATGDWFGGSVALSADGSFAFVGASFEEDAGFSSSGAVYVFARAGTSYAESQKLQAADKANDDRYGTAIAIARSAGTALIGAINKSDLSTSNNGAAYVVSLPNVFPNGTACTAASECTSGFCVDGVCCNSACGGGASSDCQACSAKAGASVDGTCGPARSSTVCRAAAGTCDLEEKCSGTSLTCPTDRLRSAGTICRSASGPCDIEERCSGTTTACPSNQYRSNTTICRTSAGPCDIAEFCTGTRPSCPADQFKPVISVCRPSVAGCDLEDYCSGVGPACPPDDLQPAGTVCRPAMQACDLAESCSGASPVCPTDRKAPDGTSCPGGMCSAGMCI